MGNWDCEQGHLADGSCHAPQPSQYKMVIKRGVNGEVIAELRELIKGDQRTICAGKLEAVADVFIGLTVKEDEEPIVELEAWA